jgi:hypothetical protein
MKMGHCIWFSRNLEYLITQIEWDSVKKWLHIISMPWDRTNISCLSLVNTLFSHKACFSSLHQLIHGSFASFYHGWSCGVWGEQLMASSAVSSEGGVRSSTSSRSPFVQRGDMQIANDERRLCKYVFHSYLFPQYRVIWCAADFEN